jgi:hypothetical protein
MKGFNRSKSAMALFAFPVLQPQRRIQPNGYAFDLSDISDGDQGTIGKGFIGSAAMVDRKRLAQIRKGNFLV